MMIRRHPVPAATSTLAAALLIAVAVLAFLSRQRAIDDKERFDHERMAAIEAKDAATAAKKKALDLNHQLVQKTEEANTRTKQAQAAQKSAEELTEKLQNQIAIAKKLKTDLTLSTEENSLATAIEDTTAYASKLGRARESINSGHFEKARETLESTSERQRHVEYKVLMAMASSVVPLFDTSSLSSGSKSQPGNFAFSNDYSKVGFMTSDMSLHYLRRGKIISLALSDGMGLSSEDYRSCRMAFSHDGRWLVMRARENRRDAIKKAWVCDTDAEKPAMTTIDFESMSKSRQGKVWIAPDESITVASGGSQLQIAPKLADRTKQRRQSTFLSSSYWDEWAVKGEIAKDSLTPIQLREGVVPQGQRALWAI
ncbi:hypothetical protein Fuma_05213 [Fuerstiella marisgermanici]|uniref:Uncharacterized protein n=2 Tax=Fuerstiella marisgermanici TaxID=1891926 RepID=A0A1P8WNB7_9PLAN|nr:hypothetical protein Fuma_05213 [Fuerstiella marisgermanici]